jgi:hypothetical protein
VLKTFTLQNVNPYQMSSSMITFQNGSIVPAWVTTLSATGKRRHQHHGGNWTAPR